MKRIEFTCSRCQEPVWEVYPNKGTVGLVITPEPKVRILPVHQMAKPAMGVHARTSAAIFGRHVKRHVKGVVVCYRPHFVTCGGKADEAED